MAAKAELRDIQALGNLDGALAKLGREVVDACRVAEGQVRGTLDWLKSRKHHWRREVELRNLELHCLQEDLEDCLSSDEDEWDRSGAVRKVDHEHCDRHDDCDGYESDISAASDRLRDAEQELEMARVWADRVSLAFDDYRRQAQEMRRLAQQQGERARIMLRTKKAQAEEYVALSGGRGSASPSRQDITAPSPDLLKLQTALNKLGQTARGRSLADAIRTRGTTITFGNTDDDFVAVYHSATNTIVLSDELRDLSPEVVACHLAHEGTHVLWDRPDSIDQEYRAFLNQASLWEELRGDQTNVRCDDVLKLTSLEPWRVKSHLAGLAAYRGLPWHA